MAITLNGVTLDARYTSAKEQLEEVGGSDAKEIILSGLIVGENTIAAIESKFDALLDAASTDDFIAPLSVRAGREIFVRRKGYNREVNVAQLTGAFKLVLEARDPFEYSTAETFVPWNFSAPTDSLTLSAAGNVDGPLVIELTATGDTTNPTFDDGERILTYSGKVLDGEQIVVNGLLRAVTIDGVDVTPYATGEFPRVQPAGNTLDYSDIDNASRALAGQIRYYDRWR